MKKKLLYFLLTFLVLISQSLILIPEFFNKANAAVGAWECEVEYISPSIVTSDTRLIKKLIIKTNTTPPAANYTVFIDSKEGSRWVRSIKADARVEGSRLIIDTPFDKEGRTEEPHEVAFPANTPVLFYVLDTNHKNEDDKWDLNSGQIQKWAYCETGIQVSDGSKSGSDNGLCRITVSNEDNGPKLNLKVDFLDTAFKNSGEFYIDITRPPSEELVHPSWGDYPASELENIAYLVENDGTVVEFAQSTYKVTIRPRNGSERCSSIFNVTVSDNEPAITTVTNGCSFDKQCGQDQVCLQPDEATPENRNPDPARRCGPRGAFNAGKTPLACEKVNKGDEDYEGKNEFRCSTALGVINTSTERFLQDILKLILGLAGGIMIIIFIINGFKLMTSQGDPEKIKEAREGIIAAVAGIFLIVLSLSILSFITVDILQIPGFS